MDIVTIFGGLMAILGFASGFGYCYILMRFWPTDGHQDANVSEISRAEQEAERIILAKFK